MHSTTQVLTQDCGPDYVTLDQNRLDQDSLDKHVASAPAEPDDFPFPTTPELPPPKPKPAKREYSDAFEQFWEPYRRKENKPGAFRCWQARLKGGAKPDELIAASKHYAEGTVDAELEFVMLPSTFLGPDRRYEDWISGIPPGRIGANGKRAPTSTPTKEYSVFDSDEFKAMKAAGKLSYAPRA